MVDVKNGRIFLTVHQEICPLDNLNLLQKEFINLSLKVSFLLNLGIFYIIVRMFLLLQEKLCKRTNNVKENVAAPNSDSSMKLLYVSPSRDDIEKVENRDSTSLVLRVVSGCTARHKPRQPCDGEIRN